MYFYAYDKLSGLMVAAVGPYPSIDEDADNEALVQSILLQQKSASASNTTGVFILMSDPQFPNPNARWRKRFAELRNDVRFPSFYFLLVTSSRLLRGVTTAVNWLSPPSASFYTEAFGTFEEATRWVEDRRNLKLPLLARLRDEVQGKIAKTSTQARAH